MGFLVDQQVVLVLVPVLKSHFELVLELKSHFELVLELKSHFELVLELVRLEQLHHP
jgi:hypothetical protein